MVSSTQSGLLAASSTQVYLLLAFIFWFGRHFITQIFICSIIVRWCKWYVNVF